MPVTTDPETLRRWGGLLAVILFAAMLIAGPSAGMSAEAHRLAAVTAVMVGLWLTQAIPIAVTSLIPLIAYPLLGIRAIDEVSSEYMSPYVFLFMGGFLIAIAIEKWNLHRRMALHIVGAIGFSQRRVVFGFMAATAFLSMWISNTASTMLMLPIGLALLTTIGDAITKDGQRDENNFAPQLGPLARALLLAIAYGASCGGLCTPIGTPTNAAFFGFWTRSGHGAVTPAPSTAEWMTMFVPVSAGMLISVGLLLTMRLPRLGSAAELGRDFFRDRLRALGAPSRQEVAMFVVFCLTALLWVTRKPLSFGELTLLPGWGPWLTDALIVQLGVAEDLAQAAPHDAIVAMGMALLTFCLPAGRDEHGRSRRLLDWETAERRMPWGMLLLIGGGFALADAFDATGLSLWVGDRFEVLFAGAEPWQLVVGVCLLMTFLTEFTTNVVMVNTLMPILAATAVSLRIDPRLLLIPATVSASCAFMLPIATPPNAIVFGSGKITMRDMMTFGFLLNLIGVVLVTIVALTLLPWVLDVAPGRLSE